MSTSELERLRVSVARIAQAIGVNGSDGPCPFRVTQGMDYGALRELARTQTRGWNELCRQIAEHATQLNTGADE